MQNSGTLNSHKGNADNNIIEVKFRRERRTVRDYLSDHGAASDIVRRLTKFYHDKGFKWVKVWLEPEEMASGRKLWNVRSNLVFKTP